jgi:regulator of ribonuclease activity A
MNTNDFMTTDLSDENPGARVLPVTLRDFGGAAKFFGPAMTVKCYEDNSRIKELSLSPGNGRVLVVDGGGSTRCALLGDKIAADLLANGWAGVIVYGCVRDRAALAGLGLGVKALGSNPRRSTKQGEGQVGVPVTIEGVPVRPGDRVYADGDGAIVLDAS